MDNQTTKSVIGKYSDKEKALAKKFYADPELVNFVKRQVLMGVTEVEIDDENVDDIHQGWMNQLAVKHIGIPLQNGGQVNEKEFLKDSTAMYTGISRLEEGFARIKLVANFKEETKEAKKKPTLR